MDVVRHPIERFWIAQVEEPLIRVGCVEHPFRMFSGDRVFGGDPLWLEPENRFDSFAVRMFANGANSAGKTIGNRLPQRRVSARVHPPMIDVDSAFKVEIHELNLVFFRTFIHPVYEVARRTRQHRCKRLSARAR